jgi:ribosomal protein L37E
VERVRVIENSFYIDSSGNSDDFMIMAENKSKGLSLEERDYIAGVLTEKGAVKPCARCGHEKFLIVDGFCAMPIQDNLEEYTLGDSNIPCTMSVCKKCGNMSFHALGAIGLMDKFKNFKKTSEEK